VWLRFPSNQNYRVSTKIPQKSVPLPQRRKSKLFHNLATQNSINSNLNKKVEEKLNQNLEVPKKTHIFASAFEERR